MAMILQKQVEVSEEIAAKADQIPVSNLITAELLDKVDATDLESFAKRFSVLVDGARVDLDTMITPFQTVVVLPLLRGG